MRCISNKFPLNLSPIFCLLLFISGCAVSPTPLDIDEMKKANSSDRTISTQDIPPITTPLTLEESIARALKYNLEHKVRVYEQALATGKLGADNFDMLPSLLSTAGYSWRSNNNSRETGGTPAVSSERSHLTGDLNFYWSLLDFGLGYFNAKENSDRVMIALEQRRRVMHNLIQNVESAYWRAAAAEKLSKQVKATIMAGETALQNSRQISSGSYGDPGTALRYQRNLLENLRLLESINSELESAKVELTGLIAAPPGKQVPIALHESLNIKEFNTPVNQLEELALLNNPDLRISHYESRIAVLETKRSILRLLPNLSFTSGAHLDDDYYLANQHWLDAGFQVSYNLFSIMSAPSKMHAAKMGVELSVVKRMAVQASLLTKLHVALQEYQDAKHLFKRADEIHRVDSQLAKLALSQEQSHTASKLTRISSDVTAILSEVRRFHSIARVRAAESRIRASVGLEPKIGNLDSIALAELTRYIATQLNQSLPLTVMQKSTAANSSFAPKSSLSDPTTRLDNLDNKSDLIPTFAELTEEAGLPSLTTPASVKEKKAQEFAEKAAQKTSSFQRFRSSPKAASWLEVGSFRLLESAKHYQQRVTIELGNNPQLLNQVSLPTLRFAGGFYRVQFGPYTSNEARDLTQKIQKKFKKSVSLRSY